MNILNYLRGMWNKCWFVKHARDGLAFCISRYFPWFVIQGSKWIQRGRQDYVDSVRQQVASSEKPGSSCGGEELWLSIFPTKGGSKEPLSWFSQRPDSCFGVNSDWPTSNMGVPNVLVTFYYARTVFRKRKQTWTIYMHTYIYLKYSMLKYLYTYIPTLTHIYIYIMYIIYTQIYIYKCIYIYIYIRICL